MEGEQMCMCYPHGLRSGFPPPPHHTVSGSPHQSHLAGTALGEAALWAAGRRWS